MSADYYETHGDRCVANTAAVDMSAIYDRFLPRVPACARILDAGSGSGRDSLAFKSLGFQVVAVDSSPAMVVATRQLAGVEVYNKTFLELSFTKPFDGIWACASLLHVRRDQLAATLKMLRRQRVTGAPLFASFKYGEQERVADDGRYFNDVTCGLLAGFLPGTDFVMEEAWTTQDVRPGRSDEQWLNVIHLAG